MGTPAKQAGGCRKQGEDVSCNTKFRIPSFAFAAEAQQLLVSQQKLLVTYLHALVPVSVVSKPNFEFGGRGLFFATVFHLFRIR